MPQIGEFTRTKNGYAGRIRTLSLDAEIVLIPAEHSDAENAPDYRVHLGDDDGPEIGAGWKRTGEKAGDYVSLADRRSHLRPADPRQPVPIGRRQVRLGSALEPSAQARRAGLNDVRSHRHQAVVGRPSAARLTAFLLLSGLLLARAAQRHRARSERAGHAHRADASVRRPHRRGRAALRHSRRWIRAVMRAKAPAMCARSPPPARWA